MPDLIATEEFELPAEILRGDKVHLRAFAEIRATQDDGETLLVTGVAYPALVVTDGMVAKGDLFRIDSYRTWMAPKTLRRFAHTFLERGTGGIDSEHDHENVGCIVESWYQTEARDGTPADVWMVTVRVLRADTIAAIRSKEITGYSIEFTGKYRKTDLRIEGGASMKTAEILSPYPLTLSLVGRPATGIALNAIETRSDNHAARTGESVLVRFALPPNDPAAARAVSDGDVMPNDDDQPTETTPAPAATPEATTTEPAATTTEPATPAASTEPATTTEPAEPATREAPVVTPPAASTDAAPQSTDTQTSTSTDPSPPDEGERSKQLARRAAVETMRASVRAAFNLTEGDATEGGASGKRSSIDYTSLAAIIAANKDFWSLSDGSKHAIYAAEYVLYEVLYGCAPEELAAKIRALGTDFAAALADVADAYEANTTTRSARSADVAAVLEAAQRAGKKISKATREKLTKAQQCARDCDGHLAELLKEEGEGEGEGESQEDSQANSIRALEAQLAELRAQVSAANADVAAERARVKVLSSDLATERSARENAEKRANAMASARPASRSDTDPVIPAARGNGASTDADDEASKHPFAGVLGLRRFVPRVSQGDADSEE